MHTPNSQHRLTSQLRTECPRRHPPRANTQEWMRPQSMWRKVLTVERFSQVHSVGQELLLEQPHLIDR